MIKAQKKAARLLAQTETAKKKGHFRLTQKCKEGNNEGINQAGY